MAWPMMDLIFDKTLKFKNRTIENDYSVNVFNW